MSIQSTPVHGKGAKRKQAAPPASTLDAEASNVKILEALKLCAELLHDLRSRKYSEFAWPFYKPVDAKLLCLYDYQLVIKQPMNLGTIRHKMDIGEYGCAKDFADDVRLMFDNCNRFYAKDHDIVLLAQHLHNLFEKRFAKIPYTNMRPALPLPEHGSNSNSSSSSQPVASTSKELVPFVPNSENASNREKLLSLASIWENMEGDLGRLLEARQRRAQGAAFQLQSPPNAPANSHAGSDFDLHDANWPAYRNAYSSFDVQQTGLQTANQLQQALANCTTSIRGRGSRGGRGRGSRGPYMKRNKHHGNSGRGNYQSLATIHNIYDSEDEDEEEEEANPEPLSASELRKLLNKVNRLSTENLVDLVNIIEVREPNVKQDTGKKYEIDFRLLSNATLRRLQRFVAKTLPKKTYKKKTKISDESRTAEAAATAMESNAAISIDSPEHMDAYAPASVTSSPTPSMSNASDIYMPEDAVNLSASSSETTSTSDSSSENDSSSTTDTSDDQSDGREAA